jgi:hypothetical protein
VAVDGNVILYRNGNKSSEMNKNPYRQLLAEDTREVIANMSEQVELLRREMVEVDSALASLGMEEKRSNDHRKEIESQVIWPLISLPSLIPLPVPI